MRAPLSEAGATENTPSAIAPTGGMDPRSITRLQLLGTIPLDVRIARADRQGLALVDLGYPELLTPFRSLQKTLQSFCTEKEKEKVL